MLIKKYNSWLLISYSPDSLRDIYFVRSFVLKVTQNECYSGSNIPAGLFCVCHSPVLWVFTVPSSMTLDQALLSSLTQIDIDWAGRKDPRDILVYKYLINISISSSPEYV